MSNLSPAPGTPQTGTKANVAGIASAVLTFAGAILAFWIADSDPFTAKELGQAVLTGAIGAGIIGGSTGVATYKATNKPTV